MGLSLSVGILVDLADEDEEGLAHWKQVFGRLQAVLRKNGLPTHSEPDQAEDLPWSRDMIGYSGLHWLRRIAAHLWVKKALPPPGDEAAPEDPVLIQLYESAAVPAGPGYEHLIHHSDAEGLYLPVDFEHPIVCAESVVPGGSIGSTPRLQNELQRLARALEVPLNLDSDDDEVVEAASSPATTGPKWKQYGKESHSLLALWGACEMSLGRKAAIVFG